MMLWQGTMEINGWVNASFKNGLGETQAILIHSVKLRHRAKALKTFFQHCKKSIIAMLIRYFSEWFQLGEIQIPDHGHITSESILALSFS